MAIVEEMAPHTYWRHELLTVTFILPLIEDLSCSVCRSVYLTVDT
jgi:hypothetical protein